MVLVTGPTGSGKTTTLYAALTEINTGEDKFITIEDPVEYQLRGVTQIPVNEKKGLTFARGLRSILRHDPDKIMVGEIRDAETGQIAVQSALTGHLVFTTVHANNAFDVLGRFLNMGIEPYNFVSSLNCILAQRLVRILCPRCKKPVKLSRKELEESALDYEQIQGPPVLRGRGVQGMQLHRLPRQEGHSRVPRPLRPYQGDDPRKTAVLGAPQGRDRRRDDHPPPVGGRQGPCRRYDPEGDQQGNVHRMRHDTDRRENPSCQFERIHNYGSSEYFVGRFSLFLTQHMSRFYFFLHPSSQLRVPPRRDSWDAGAS